MGKHRVKDWPGSSWAAKEVGIAVNDFAKTPVGQLSMALIVWHMVGGAIIHVLGGILIWIVGFGAIHYMIKRAYPDTVIYDEEKKNIFGNAAIKRVERVAMNDDTAGEWLLAYAVVLIAGLITIFTF